MLENFIYSVNVILPIFILVSLGVILKRLKVIPENFSDAVDKLIFKLGLPAMLFKEVAGSNISEALNVKLAIFAAVTTGNFTDKKRYRVSYFLRLQRKEMTISHPKCYIKSGGT